MTLTRFGLSERTSDYPNILAKSILYPESLPGMMNLYPEPWWSPCPLPREAHTPWLMVRQPLAPPWTTLKHHISFRAPMVLAKAPLKWPHSSALPSAQFCFFPSKVWVPESSLTDLLPATLHLRIHFSCSPVCSDSQNEHSNFCK